MLRDACSNDGGKGWWRWWSRLGGLLAMATAISCLVAPFPGASANPEAKRLYDDLLSNYNRLIRPVGNNSDRLTVKMGLRLSQLIDVVSTFPNHCSRNKTMSNLDLEKSTFLSSNFRPVVLNRSFINLEKKFHQKVPLKKIVFFAKSVILKKLRTAVLEILISPLVRMINPLPSASIPMEGIRNPSMVVVKSTDEHPE